MTQFNNVNVKLSIFRLNKLKSALRNATEVALKLSLNMIGDSNDETNFSQKLILTDRQVSKLRKKFANDLLAYIKLSNTELSKIVQLGRFIGRLLGQLIKTRLRLIKMYLNH